ncbi:endonuclease V-like isoform X2 [Mya arenaria]|uniref:endonuclease V-like isoform X2 n=1 Tax=Mya arenaria TaxID=6604 RepID=UPI0022E2F3EB|nr:endonuclease V-like isoform X2 [Mya arenaria]
MCLFRRLSELFYRYVLDPLGFYVPRLSRAEKLLPEEIRLKWEREQEALKERLVLEDTEDLKVMATLGPEDTDLIKQFYIAGVDISFIKGDDVNACAALVILSYPQLEVAYNDCQMVKLTAPYIPGFLGFREVPMIQKLFDQLKRERPDLVPHCVMVDGNGILHPKEFGSACHLGVSLGLPCIGVAKKLFHVDGLEKDASHKEKALRSCDTTKNPIYISQGHLVSMDTSVRLVQHCCRHRVPEPVRLADINSREYLRTLDDFVNGPTSS